MAVRVLAAVALAAMATIIAERAVALARSPDGASPSECGLPSPKPLWIDYGEGSVKPDVRAVLARPGVVVSTSGPALAATFRRQGAATTYFVLHLSDLVGLPSEPADAATIADAAAGLLARAQATTGCDKPWIALNELAGPGAPAPWSASIAQYRANLLILEQQLASRGAHPILFVHGDPNLDGDAAGWWRQIAQAGAVAYEAYYDASRISALGPVMGNRRMRLGIRSFVARFTEIGIEPDRLGVVLGFHSGQTPGIGGRQGLQPREEWLRVVKWEALAARQVAVDVGLSSIWSWGWGTFGPESVDADKAAAACVWLWTRNAKLCDGPGAGGPAFNTSLSEGQVLLGDAYCVFPGGYITAAAVEELAAFIGDQHAALTALFARRALGQAVSISSEQVLEIERSVVAQAFHGSQVAYLRALARRSAKLEIARGVIRDELRRRAIASMLAGTGSSETTLQWTDDYEASVIDGAICRQDDLPGTGNFPASNAREIGVVPLPALLRFLFADVTPPATPPTPSATAGLGAVSLAWAYSPEPDVAGYRVFRSAASGGPYTRVSETLTYTSLGETLLPRPAFVDVTAPLGQTSYYIVRAVDTSGNASAPSVEVAAAPG
jgi:hypothetical protein